MPNVLIQFIVLDVPYEDTSNSTTNNFLAGFNLQNFDQIEEVGVNEIMCEDIYKITDKN